jgi:serine/threonine protein kinase
MNEPCPDATMLKALLEQTLPEPRLLAVEGHVQECNSCQIWLDTESGLRHLQVPEASAPPPPEAIARWLNPQLSARITPGSQVGAYRIDAIIGSGGMGIVYRATDTTLGRPVAVKVLMTVLDPEAAERFVYEVQAAARVQHDHIVQVYAAVDPPGGPAHMVMEFVDGPTLREASAKARGLDSRRSAEIVAQIADALDAVHTVGLVHRDVKPANVLLDKVTGRAKLADFGLARVTESEHVTRSGMLVGTPVYMAPERVQNPTNSGPLVDVYGLGATLYEALTGTEPFRGSRELILAQVLADEPIPPRRLNPAVPRDLETICLKSMAKDPSSRYLTAGAMRDDLRRWLDGKPILARPLSWFGRCRRLAKRNPIITGLLATLTIGAVASFAIVTWLWLDSRASAEAAKKSAEIAMLERAKADQDYRAAEQVVDLFYQRLYDRGTVAAAINIDTRLELIREAIAFYEQVSKRRPGDKPPAELAAAYARKGMLHNMLKETEPAADSFHSALALFEQAERSGPVSDKLRREHAECEFYLGISAGRSRDAKGAMAHYEAAITRLSQLAATDPQANYFLAGSIGNLAGVYEYLGEIEKSRATHQKALTIYRQTREANPKNGGALQDLIWSTLSIARLEPVAKASVEQLTAAYSLIEQYGRENPTDYNRADVGCSYHTELAIANLRAGKTADALEAAEKALQMAKTMAGYPPQFRRPSSQAAAWRAEAMARNAYGDQQAAITAWTKAAELYESLDWNALGTAFSKNTLASIYDSLAARAASRSDAKEAEAFRNRAAETRERLKKEHPQLKAGVRPVSLLPSQE